MSTPTSPPRINTLLAQVPVRAQPPRLDPESPPGSLSGALWGDLEIGDLIGRGGMGEVYLARQGGTGRMVALKVMHPQAMLSDDLRQRFASEARAAALVRSPHVVGVYASGEHDGRPWLALEYVAGETLDQALRGRLAAGRGFTPREVVGLITQAALGLAAAHRERLVHRDLKPANLMLSHDGVVKVTDFGLVRFVDQRLTRSGQVLGTPRYIAPEQGRGLETDARSDLYSLGVVMYELLTGRPPFEGETAEALIFQHNFSEPVLPAQRNPDIPLDVQSVCLKCLQKDPAQRYADAADLTRDLQRLDGGLAPLSAVFAPGALNTGASQALRRLAGWRRRWWAVAGSVVAAILLVAVAAWWWDGRKTELVALRGRLAPVARPAAVPATAAADGERLATLAGDADPQVVQARAKLARLATLTSRLEELTAHRGADREVQAAARDTLAACSDLIGPAGDPRQERWAAWLAAAAARSEIVSGFDAWPPASRTLPALQAACDRLVQLDPADPDLDGWRRQLAAEQAALAGHRATLARLEVQAGGLDRQSAAELEGSLAWLIAREDVDEARRERLRTRLERRAIHERQDRLRELAEAAARRAVTWVLPADAVPPARAELAEWRGLAGDDPSLAAAVARLDELCGPVAPPWATARGHDGHGPWLELTASGVRQRLRWLPSGSFRMGSPPDEAGRDDDEVQVRVRLSRGLWVAERECSQELWLAVMGTRPSEHQAAAQPVEQVSAADAAAFCRALGVLLPGCTARLPSEAEWEAAVRAGDPGTWAGITAAQAAAAVVHQGSDGPAPPGGRPANALGLLDGPGNVWEWCATGYGPHPAGGAVSDPFPAVLRLQVARGGSWGDPLAACRVANRVGLDPATASPYLGFRFVVQP